MKNLKKSNNVTKRKYSRKYFANRTKIIFRSANNISEICNKVNTRNLTKYDMEK